MFAKIKDFSELVMFQHSIFSMPFIFGLFFLLPVANIKDLVS